MTTQSSATIAKSNGPAKTRGSNRTPSIRSPYRGRNPRKIRAQQNQLFAINRQEPTAAQKGALNSLAAPLERYSNGGGR